MRVQFLVTCFCYMIQYIRYSLFGVYTKEVFMGFFKTLFKRKNKTNEKTIPVTHIECIKMLELNSVLESLFSKNKYISKKEYKLLLAGFEKTIDFFSVLQTSNTLELFCKNNGVNFKIIEKTLRNYLEIDKIIDNLNDTYVHSALQQEKEYLDNILKEVDPNIILDENQREVVLTDEDYSLVIAGAGAGKTTTVAAKVKYLVEKNNVAPSQILVISFTNKAVQELRDKINKDLKIQCPVTTFHSTGNAIIRKQNPELLNIVESSKLYYVLQDYFKNSLLKNERLVNNLILFFATYFDAPYEGNDLNTFFNKIAKANFTTMKSDLEDFKTEVIDARTKKYVTIQSEVLRSYQEVEIANFLYLNNIDYDYEPIYPYHILYANKPYTPDFIIRQGDLTAYIEHFGITQEGKNSRYNNDQLETYKRSIKQKIKLHKEHDTTLIYTFSQYTDRRTLTEHLKEELEKAGFVLSRRTNQEVIQKLVSTEENRYIRKLLNLICRFITNFKTNGYTSEDFDRMYHSTVNVRSKLFLNICQECFLEYEKYLKENNAVDFQDMINESARLLREVKEMKQKLDFKYIIVDEYQDISRQRFDLVTALSDITDAKIIAVGDDWQSIYAFSGSDITLFTKFEEKMGYAKLLKIVNTYRNSQEVIDIAGNFIQKNSSQITKDLKSPKSITNPVIIYTYDSSKKLPDADRRSGANYEMAHAVEIAIEQILAFEKQEGKKEHGSILLLGRFGFDGDHLQNSGLFEYVTHGNRIKSVKYPKLNISFMTAHSSKGLGYDNVIIINGKNETYGFPAKIEDDPVLSFVIKEDRSIDYAEERRLFYVAMTRTKNRVFIIAPERNPSEFLLEIKHDYTNVALRGNWNENPPDNQNGKKKCPVCGYPMQLKYKKSYGLRLYICTNEPEVCGFMTNDYKGGKLSIVKCEKCQDGYLIVKPGTKENKFFLGCTNYNKNGKGCNHVISQSQYYELMNYRFSTSESSVQREKPVRQVNSLQAEENNITNTSNKEENEIIKMPSGIEIILYQETDLNELLYDILFTVQQISIKKHYGISILLDILRGVENPQIVKNNFISSPVYGKYKKVLREILHATIEWMIVNRFLLKTKERFPTLHLTHKGIHYGENITKKQLTKLKQYLEEDVILWTE